MNFQVFQAKRIKLIGYKTNRKKKFLKIHGTSDSWRRKRIGTKWALFIIYMKDAVIPFSFIFSLKLLFFKVKDVSLVPKLNLGTPLPGASNKDVTITSDFTPSSDLTPKSSASLCNIN